MSTGSVCPVLATAGNTSSAASRSGRMVSIYIPTRNRVELLKRAVNSVLAQDYQNFELIVVDDGSSDGTPEYLSDIAKQDCRVRYFINRQNIGACASRNRAIQEARGEFITGLDDDDFFLPFRISSFVQAWIDEPETVAFYSSALLRTKLGSVTPLPRPAVVVREDLLRRNRVGNQVFTRTETLKSVGGFDIHLPAWQDIECWYRLLRGSGTQMRLVNNHSYVVDESHGFDRISSADVQRIENALEIFVSKHELSEQERASLELQLHAYNSAGITVSRALWALLVARNARAAATMMIAYLSRLARLT